MKMHKLLVVVPVVSVVAFIAIAFCPPGKDRVSDPSFTPEQRAWEAVLQKELGSFYYPRYLDAKAIGRVTAWDFVKDDSSLSRVLIIGDSISRGCTVPIRDALKGRANVHRAPANCGSTTNGLAKLDLWLGDDNWDLIVFNFGIHDRNIASDVYEHNLKTMISRLRPRSQTLLWLTTTPVPVGADEYVDGSIHRLNQTATSVMEMSGVSVFDLHAAILPNLKLYQLKKNCHFKEKGYRFMGKLIAQEVTALLEDETAYHAPFMKKVD